MPRSYFFKFGVAILCIYAAGFALVMKVAPQQENVSVRTPQQSDGSKSEGTKNSLYHGMAGDKAGKLEDFALHQHALVKGFSDDVRVPSMPRGSFFGRPSSLFTIKSRPSNKMVSEQEGAQKNDFTTYLGAINDNNEEGGSKKFVPVLPYPSPNCDAIANPSEADITLVTSASPERFHLLDPICRRWSGHISVAIFTNKTVEDTLKGIEALPGCSSIKERSVDADID